MVETKTELGQEGETQCPPTHEYIGLVERALDQKTVHLLENTKANQEALWKLLNKRGKASLWKP